MLGSKVSLVLVVSTALLVPAPTGGAPAGAVEATCQGETATIVGDGTITDSLEGTEGPDVIVTNRATSTDGRGGDDLICVTGEVAEDHPVRVVDGAGDDQVYNLSPTIPQVFFDRFEFTLEAGDDLLVGGPGEDLVETFDGADDIDTGGGADTVIVRNSRTSEPFDGRIVLGAGGGEVLLQRLVAPEAVLDGGTGSSRVRLFRTFAGEWDVDAGAGAATLDGEAALHWSGFDRFYWDDNPVRFHGTDAAESVGGLRILEADMQGGDDEVLIGLSREAAPGMLDGGEGTDLLHASSYGDPGPTPITLVVDAASGTATFEGGGTSYEFSDFESLSGTGAGSLVMLGTDGPDVFDATGCDVVLRGRGGDDVLAAHGDECWLKGTFYGGPGDDRLVGGRYVRLLGESGNDRLESSDVLRGSGGRGNDDLIGGSRDDYARGGPGADLLRGRQGRDRLVGGPGRDTARGGPGRDVCRAEVRSSCEAR